MNDYLEKMHEHLERHEQSQVRGLSTRDVVARTYSEVDLLKLVEELKSETSLASSAFQLCSFIYERQEDRVPDRIRQKAADTVADFASTLRPGIDQGAVEIFVVWGTHRQDYKSTCLHILDHSEAWIREIVLTYAGRFLLRGDFSKLFKFQHDRYVSEIAMGGPLRFLLRDRALMILKQLTNSSVSEDDCFEKTSEGQVFYRSWTPFLNWLYRYERCRAISFGIFETAGQHLLSPHRRLVTCLAVYGE